MTTAPDLYALNDDELHDELQRIEVLASFPVGTAMVSAGMRRDPLTGAHHPVTVVQGPDGLHALHSLDTDTP